MEIIKRVPSFSDARGAIFDLLENERINAVTVVTFRKGAVRGNHFHKLTTQWNYLISGCVRIVSRPAGIGATIEAVMHPGDMVVTAPNVHHALVGLEDSEVMVFTKGPRGGKEYESDTYRLDQPLVSAP